MMAHGTGTDANAALCLCSLLSNLRKLTLGGVIFYLPALQPAATRLRELTLNNCRLQGSSDGFLTRSWTALTSLSLIHTEMQSATLTAALNLPALQEARLCWFSGHLGQELQLDQLAGSCPQVSRLVFDAGRSLAQASEADRQSCRLLNLSRLADLYIRDRALLTNVDLDLAPSLTQLRFGGECVDFFWALREAAKCSGRGAQLRRLTCECARAHLQPAQWGASLDEQHRRLGGQLGSLRELEVWGVQEQLLSAVGAIASAAPSLGRLVIIMKDPMPRVEVSPICSASLESIRVGWGFGHRPELPPPEVLLTLLPGCTRLGEVVVHFSGKPVEGAAVKIRCHGFSRRCIVPVDGYAHNYKRAPEEVNVDTVSIVRVRFLQRPPSEQGVQECTVLYGCHVAGPEEPPMWGHAVMPGIL